MKHLLSALLLASVSLSLLASCAASQAQGYHAFDDSRKNIGIYLNNPEDVKRLEEQPDIYPWFENWYGREANNKLKFCRNNPQYTPMITWMPTGIPLSEIAEGKHDKYIKRFLGKITRVCPNRDILIRFAHEMELRPGYGAGWYSWQREGAENYKNAWIHLVTLAREINPGFKWIWAPNRADEYTTPYYPGDEYVDYVGLTLNHVSNRRFAYKYFQDFYELEGTRESLEAYGKKILICEVAYFSDDSARKASYLKSVFDYYKTDDRLCAVAFFNENKTEQKMFMISDNEEYMRIFCEGVRSVRNEETDE